MLNFLWAGMLLLGVVYAAFAGTLPDITEAALNGAKEAVELCLSVAGVVAFWNGLMTIAKESGLISLAAKRVRPFLLWLMPGLKGEDTALEAVSVNMAANVLGLGWAATTAGLKAMEELDRIEEASREKFSKNRQNWTKAASDEMCIFLILNISSLQLIPVNIIAYRSQYGSTDPAAVTGPGLLATAASTAAAVLFCHVWQRSQQPRHPGRRKGEER